MTGLSKRVERVSAGGIKIATCQTGIPSVSDFFVDPFNCCQVQL